MTREIVQHELDEIKTVVVQTATLVECTLTHAVQALLLHDVALAKRVIESDAVVDAEQQHNRTRTMYVIARQAPMDRDLRGLLTLQLVMDELEQMGDLAVEIAQQAIRLASQPAVQAVGALPEMARLVCQQLRGACHALVQGDLEGAREICARDDAVDLLYHHLFEDVLLLMQEADQAPQATSLLFVAHDLERIGDRVTTICEDLIYLVTGEREHLNRGSGQLLLARP
jgi:phosphate transport system protein